MRSLITALVIGLLVIGLAFAIGGSEEGDLNLSAAEARREAGKALRNEYGPGKLGISCPTVRAANFRRCSYNYVGGAGRFWHGEISVRELESSYRFRLLEQ